MKVYSNLRLLAFLVWAWALVAPRAGAQAILLSVNNSPNPVQTNASLTHTIQLINGTGIALPNVYVTNRLPASVLLVTNTTTRGSAIITNSSVVVFNLGSLIPNDAVIMTVVTIPTVGGFITNVFTAADLSQTNLTTTTNIVTRVTGAQASQTDLAVSVVVPGPDVFVNDSITYNITVTNLGGASASSVVLSNSFLPANVKLVNNGTTNINAGTLPALSAKTFALTVQPTNAGALPFSASVTFLGTDSNTNNNSFATNIVVSDFLTNELEVILVSTQLLFNPENGLMEQRILVSNASAATVDSARVIVSGFGPTNRLANAVGTNDGKPFVVHGAALAPAESVGLLLLYKVPTHEPFPLSKSNLVARAVTAADLSPPAILGTQVSPTRIVNVNGAMYVEFPSTNGRTYTVIYSDDAMFSNPKLARPSTVAPANWTYFIDYGPPETISAPTNSSSRFYHIYQNP